MRQLVAALLLACVACGSIALAAPIDDFSVAQPALSLTFPPAGTSASSAVDAPSIMGGQRNIQVQLASGVIAGNTLTAVVSSGFFSYSQDATIGGSAQLQWDGADGSSALDPTGLGGVDLTAGGLQNALSLAVVFDDLPTDYTLRVFTDGGNASSFSSTLPGLIFANQTFTVPFAQFSTSLGTGADFSNVGAIELELGSSSTAPDVVIDTFDAVSTLSAGQTAALLVDNLDSGIANPGDSIRYTLIVTNPDDALDAAESDVAVAGLLDANTTLIVGSVTTTQGTVSSGNMAGDSAVDVDLGMIGDAGTATITFDVNVNDPLPGGTMEISTQSSLSSATLLNVLSDDPGEPGTADPTVVAASTVPVTLQGFSVE